ncbi:hypothetical protein CL634_01455 [bacterium]|nr:hypothetical protein [bacterium]
MPHSKTRGRTELDATGHIHTFEIGEEGNGRTIRTIGASADHFHDIENYSVVTGGKHLHSHQITQRSRNRVDADGMVGSIVPNVYIRKIKLESKTLAEASHVKWGDNPHIDDPREGTTNVSLGTVATLDFVLKEVFKDNIVGRWAHNQNLFSTMKIKVIRSINKDSTDYLKLLGRTPARIWPILLQILDGQLAGTITHDIDVGSVIAERLRVDEALAGQPGDRRAEYTNLRTSTVDSDGNIIQNFNIPWVDFMLPKNLTHLTYIAFVYLDLAEEEDLEIDQSDINYLMSVTGRIISETVIEGGSVINNGVIYRYLENNEVVWPGAVHRMPDGSYMTGERHTPDSKKLIRQTVSVSKVQDLRAIERIEKLQVDLSVIEKELFPQTISSLRQLSNHSPSFIHAPIGIKNAFFTDLFMSSDVENRCRFLFGIDYYNLLKENTKFGRLYDLVGKVLAEMPDRRGDVEGTDIIDLKPSSLIASLKLKRRRIVDKTAYNKLTSPIPGEELMEKNEADIILVHTKDRANPGIRGPGLKSYFSSAASLDEVELTLPETPFQEKMRYLTGMDKSINKISHGLYQYGIELEVEDRSGEFLYELLTRLTDAEKAFVEYYSRSIQPGNYNLASNRFTERFITQEWHFGDGVRRRLKIKLADDYANILWLLTQLSSLISERDGGTPKTRMHLVEIRYIIRSLIDPQITDPDGIHMVVMLIGKLASQISRMINPEVKRIKSLSRDPHVAARDNLNESNILKSTPPSYKTFTVEKWFDNKTFDADLTKGVGYEYLLPYRDELVHPGNRLFEVNNEIFAKRIEEEVLKYFTETDIDISMAIRGNEAGIRPRVLTEGDTPKLRDYEFLSPSKGNVRGEIINFDRLPSSVLEDDLEGFEVYRAFEHLIRYHNIYQTSFGAPPGSLGSAQWKVELWEALMRALGLAPWMGGQQDPNFNPCDEIAWWARGEGGRPPGDVPGFNNDPGGLPRVPREAPPWWFDPGRDGPPRLPPFELLAMCGLDPRTLGLDCRVDRHIDVFNVIEFCNAVDRHRPPWDGVGGQPSLEDGIESLPNQIKSLILGNLRPAAVHIDWFSSFGRGENLFRPTCDSILGPIFRFNYGMLRRIEVLVKFDTIENGELSTKIPVFEPLSRHIHQQKGLLAEPRFLCRLVPFKDNNFGLNETEKELQLPIYNEYFILNTRGADVPIEPAIEGEIEAEVDVIEEGPQIIGDDIIEQDIPNEFVNLGNGMPDLPEEVIVPDQFGREPGLIPLPAGAGPRPLPPEVDPALGPPGGFDWEGNGDGGGGYI